MIFGVSIAPRKIIHAPGGDILHCLKITDPEFTQFGEAYFSFIHQNHIKGWKLHKDMTLNIVVPSGRILFVLHDTRNDSPTKNLYQEV